MNPFRVKPIGDLNCFLLESDQKGALQTPNEFREMLEKDGFHAEKIVRKGYIMHLQVSKDLFMKKEFYEDLSDIVVQRASLRHENASVDLYEDSSREKSQTRAVLKSRDD